MYFIFVIFLTRSIQVDFKEWLRLFVPVENVDHRFGVEVFSFSAAIISDEVTDDSIPLMKIRNPLALFSW